MKTSINSIFIRVFFSVTFFSLLSNNILHAETAPDIAPNTTKEMQHPEFWVSQIKGNPDRVIMTPEHIDRLNRKNRGRSLETTDINGKPYSIKNAIDSKDIIGVQFVFENPLTITTFPGDSLCARFIRHRNYFENRDFFDRRLLKYDRNMKNEFFEKTDFDSIPDRIIPRYGILVAHTLNRVLPTNLPAWGSANGWLDMLQSTSIDFGTPVAILHTSKDKEWYYVRSEIAFGWIPATHVAEGTINQIEKIVSAEDFIIATCHKIPVYSDKEFKTFMVDFYMGARLPLRMKSVNGYEVMVPHREADGSLNIVRGWVQPDANVSTGYQPFTQRNIITTFFSLLYRPYGWADSCNERDCCGTVRAVYKTFGIFLPRWTTHELHSTDHVYAFPRKTQKEVKYGIIEKCEPAITLVGHSGHIVMYLGKVNDSHYVIHQNGYSYNAEDGTRMDVRRVYVNDTELDGGSNVDTWTEISVFNP